MSSTMRIWIYSAISLLWFAISIVQVVNIISQPKFALGFLWLLSSMIVWFLIINVMMKQCKSMQNESEIANDEDPTEGKVETATKQAHWKLDPFRVGVLLAWHITTILVAYGLQFVISDHTSVISLCSLYGVSTAAVWAFLLCIPIPEDGNSGLQHQNRDGHDIFQSGQSKDEAHHEHIEDINIEDIKETESTRISSNTGIATTTDDEANSRPAYLDRDMILHDLESHSSKNNIIPGVAINSSLYEI